MISFCYVCNVFVPSLYMYIKLWHKTCVLQQEKAGNGWKVWCQKKIRLRKKASAHPEHKKRPLKNEQLILVLSSKKSWFHNNLTFLTWTEFVVRKWNVLWENSNSKFLMFKIIFLYLCILHNKSTIKGYNSRIIETNKFSIPKSECRDTKKTRNKSEKLVWRW